MQTEPASPRRVCRWIPARRLGPTIRALSITGASGGKALAPVRLYLDTL